MKKRGISAVVTSILLTLLAIIAIVLIWVILKGFLTKTSSGVETSCLTLDLEIKKAEINFSSDILYVKVERGSGEANLTGIRFKITNSSASIIRDRNTSMKELWAETFSFSDVGNVSFISKIEIAGIFSFDSKEKVCRIIDSKKAIGTYVPPTAQVCGNEQCEAGETNQNCPQDCPSQVYCGDGNCVGNETCSNCEQDCQACFSITNYNLTKITQQSKVIDINNDGLLDVVVLVEKAKEGFVRILYQQTNGSLSLSEKEYITNHGADMINSGDVNNDGLNDIVVTTDDISANVTAFLYQQTNGSFKLVFKPAPGLPTSAGSPDIGDIDKDGLNDVVRGNKARGSISIYYQNTSHDLGKPVEIFITAPVKSWRSSDGRIADYNNDGKNDFAVRNGVLQNGNAFFTVFYNLGNRQFEIINYDTGITSQTSLSDIRVGDLNNDGLTDVVISVQEGSIVTYLQKQGNLEKNIYSSGLQSIRGLAVGDINKDGKDDIVVSSFNCNEGISILLQNETGFREPTEISSADGLGGFVDVGDVDNDNNLEIITTNGLTSQTTNCPPNSISVINLNPNLFR